MKWYERLEWCALGLMLCILTILIAKDVKGPPRVQKSKEYF